MNMIRSKMMLAVLFGALIALFAGSAAGAQDDPYATTTTTGGETTTTLPDGIPEVTAVAGETITVDGTSCAPGATVTVRWDDGTVLGTFTADDDGNFTTTVTIPSNASVGVHTMTATCGDVVQYLNVNVLADSVTTIDNGTLARTGSNSTTPLLFVGAAALVLGGAFLYGARKPRQA